MRQTALITGASRGIGYELAKVFAEHGFDLIVVARSEESLNALANECRSEHGVQVDVLASDLLDADAPARLVESVDKRDLRVDVLVNDAGLLESGRFEEIELGANLRLMDLNLRVLTELTHRLLGGMIERGRGRILNVASLSAFQPVPMLALYAASKAFVLSLSESLSEELRGTGVSVTALCPGLTKTEMFDRAQEATAAARWTPDFLVSDARSVAVDGYQACMARRAVVVPGFPNRLMASLTPMYPRSLVRGMGGWLGRRFN
jgi:short-subunit dehydrogenase